MLCSHAPMVQARVNIPDERFNWLVDLYKPKTTIPAFLEIVDIAGLVKGAAQGEGLGNAFLSHIMVRRSLLCEGTRMLYNDVLFWSQY